MTGILVLSYLVGAAVFLHAVSRSPSAWAEADRDRGSWLGGLGAAAILGVGLFAAPIYLVGVVPRLGSSARPGTSDQFKKTT